MKFDKKMSYSFDKKWIQASTIWFMHCVSVLPTHFFIASVKQSLSSVSLPHFHSSTPLPHSSLLFSYSSLFFTLITLHVSFLFSLFLVCKNITYTHTPLHLSFFFGETLSIFLQMYSSRT